MPAVLEPSLPISLQLSSSYSVSMGSGGGREGGREGREVAREGREVAREGEGREGGREGERGVREGGREKRMNQDHLQVGHVIGAGVGAMAAALGWGMWGCGGFPLVPCCLCSHNISCPPIYPTHSLPGASRWGGIQVLLY